MKPYINLFTGICLALATIFLCGMDGCSPTDEADPAVFVSASPADGSTLQESATIVATFDAPPSGLNVQVPAGGDLFCRRFGCDDNRRLSTGTPESRSDVG